jgi:DNA modification methylase
LSLPDCSRPEFANYFIDRYSSAGEIVLDPFCGSGTVAAEALLRGRIPYASDANPIAVLATEARLDPADITEVTLFLQMINLRKPVNAGIYRQVFSSFYDLNTWRELVNLRSAVSGNDERTARFVKALTLSLLHGHTASYLSVYTSPQVAIAPDQQELLNIKRRQTPDYRAVVPRLLRKSAMVMRDGITNAMRKSRSQHRVAVSDARNLKHLASGSVHLVLTSPPVPHGRDPIAEMWLKNWFAGCSDDVLSRRLYPVADTSSDSLEQWLDFMGEVLLETARVVAPGGRAVFNLGESDYVARNELDHRLLALVQEGFSRYWEPECTLINLGKEQNRSERPEGERKNQRSVSNRVLVLRRR